MKTKITLLLTFISISLFAQELAYKKISWESEPKLHTVSDKEKEYSYVVLKDQITLEFVYESSGELVMDEKRNKIVQVNNDAGIEEMNKVYIPYTRVLEEMDLKARTITSAGKIIPLDKNASKKVDNVENSGAYIIFVMEGLDVGGEIEYIYTNKKSSLTSSLWRLQISKPLKNVSVDIYSPDNLIFEGKGFNGLPDFVKDTVIEDKNHISTKIDFIEGLNEEKYSAYDANKMRFEYQLIYNTARSRARMYTWEYCGLEMYSALFNLEKKEIKAVDKLVSKLSLKNLSSDEQKVHKLDQFLKTNINYKEVQGTISVDKMMDLKYGDAVSFIKTYIGACKTLNIPIEVVLTTDRFDRKFDGTFSTWNNLQEYLLYFPSTGKYLSPTVFTSRLGFPSPECTGNKGLFIKETQIGDIKAPVSKVKYIEPATFDVSSSNITANVVIDNTSFMPSVSMKQEMKGYSAFYTQPILPYLDEAQNKEMMNDLAKTIGKESILKSYKASGTEIEDALVKPLIIESELDAPQLIENAGNKYLFKVGQLIGPQVELYQEKARQSDADIDYNHSFTRILEIKIPDGYKIKNPDDINIKKECMLDGKVVASFVSSYTYENNVLKIKVYEDYRITNYPKNIFESFRAVINASADFNKVVLILEK